MNKPPMDTGSAEGVFTRSLQRIFQHVSADGAQQPLINIAHEALNIITHALHTFNLFKNPKHTEIKQSLCCICMDRSTKRPEKFSKHGDLNVNKDVNMWMQTHTHTLETFRFKWEFENCTAGCQNCNFPSRYSELWKQRLWHSWAVLLLNAVNELNCSSHCEMYSFYLHEFYLKPKHHRSSNGNVCFSF